MPIRPYPYTGTRQDQCVRPPRDQASQRASDFNSDASEKACGGTLLQERRESPEKPPVFEVISFVSCKFTGAAERWDIPKKEAYAIYYSVKELAYYLEVKPFVIETDHANLVWIEKSEAAIIIRWRLFLQGFAFKIRHIPGKANVFADMLSRMYRLA